MSLEGGLIPYITKIIVGSNACSASLLISEPSPQTPVVCFILQREEKIIFMKF